MSYSVVIPCYKNFEELELLLLDIAHTNKRHKPERIIVVNDSNDSSIQYAKGLLSSELLPEIETIDIRQHLGPLGAFEVGLDSVTTDYAILLHSDTRLSNENSVNGQKFTSIMNGTKYMFTVDIYDDPLSVLYSYIKQTKDAGIVACHTLQREHYRYIAGGIRSLGRDRLPYSNTRNYMFETLWLYGKHVAGEAWQRVHSVDSYAFAVKMEAYNKTKFNHAYAPYLYFFDDFCARLRMNANHIYVTTDTVVYHPYTSKSIDGKKSKPKLEDYRKAVDLFKREYNLHPIWDGYALEEYYVSEVYQR